MLSVLTHTTVEIDWPGSNETATKPKCQDQQLLN